MKYILITMIIMLNLSCLRDPYEEHTTLYVVNQGDNTISCYNIDYNGTLFDKGTVSLPGAGVMKVHPKGKFIYVETGGANYVVYKADDDGTLNNYHSFSIGRGSALFADGYNFFSPDGKWHTWCDGNISFYFDAVDQNTGELILLPVITPGGYCGSPIFHPSNNYYYILWQTSGYFTFQVTETGSEPTYLHSGAFSFLSPNRTVIHPSGKFIYGLDDVPPATNVSFIPVINNGSDIDSANAVTYPISPTGTNFGIYLNPNGKFVYAIAGNNIFGFKINHSTGALTSMGISYTFPAAPFLAAFYPDGHWLYVTHPATNSVSILNVDDSTGLITLNRTITVGTSPNYIGIGRISKER